MPAVLKQKEYLVPDVLAPGLRVVFCGTALGHESARQQAYYAHPGNQFWPALHRSGFTPARITPRDYASVLAYGIGLTDVCKIHSGNDHELPEGSFDAPALRLKIMQYQLRWLAFTSKNAAAAGLECPVFRLEYGKQKERIGNTSLWVLPSPSGQARRWWREELWKALAEEVKNDYMFSS